MKKVILFFIIGAHASKEELDMARSIGASIRDANRVSLDQKEHCDFVAGKIPSIYKNKPIFETAADMSEILDGPDDSEGDPEDDSEITLAKLEALTKDNLLAFAEENEIELTKEDKKNKGNLVEAIAEHLELV